MNESTLVILLVAIGMLLLAWVLWPRRVHKITGNPSELEPRIARLMQSHSQTFLIVRIAGTDDFLQLTAARNGAQIDFPMITDRQRALESKVREAAAELQLSFRETKGTDGSRFLDCDFQGTSHDVTLTCRRLLTRVFGATDDAGLVFESDANI